MKKKILASIITILVMTISMNGQELFKKEIDQFTGSTKVITKTYIVGKGVGKLFAYTARVNDDYAIFLFNTVDLGCSGSRNNYVIFLFDDGTTLHLTEDISKVNCKLGSPSIYTVNPEDFIGKTISAIRFSQSESYDDCDYIGMYSIGELLIAVK